MERRKKIAGNFSDNYLHSDNGIVLEATVQSIRSLLNAKICMNELITDDMVKTVGGIVLT